MAAPVWSNRTGQASSGCLATGSRRGNALHKDAQIACSRQGRKIIVRTVYEYAAKEHPVS